MHPSELMRELISSIRDTKTRINELKSLVKGDFCRPERKKEVIGRIERLIETRLQLLYSIYDIRHRFLAYLSTESERKALEEKFSVGTLYKMIKEE